MVATLALHPHSLIHFWVVSGLPAPIKHNSQWNIQFQLLPSGPLPSSVTHSAGKGNQCWGVEFSPQIKMLWLLAKLEKQLQGKLVLFYFTLPVGEIFNINTQQACPFGFRSHPPSLYNTYCTLPLKTISGDNPEIKMRKQPESVSFLLCFMSHAIPAPFHLSWQRFVFLPLKVKSTFITQYRKKWN